MAVELLVAADRVPALAPPVHVPGQHPGDRAGRRLLYDAFSRPRPYGVTTIGRWAGFSMPSPPVARPRRRPGRRSSTRWSSAGSPADVAKLVVAAVLAGLRRRPPLPGRRPPLRRDRRARPRASPSRSPPSGCSRRTRSFPVAYRQGKTAHLDVARPPGRGHPPGGARPARARPCSTSSRSGLEGSGGSTPLRLRVEGDPATRLPVRQALRHEPRPGRPLVQARPHDPLRAARGRGPVPDRAPAGRVRGLRAAAAARRRHPDRRRRYGIVEITPEREYLLVTSSSTAPARSATPRSTTASSTRASSSSAGCGTPAWPTATSSRPTCSSATARCS